MSKKNDILFYEKVILPLYDQMYGYIYSAVSDHSIAEDLTQAVFEKAFKYLYQLKDRGKVKSWMRTIAANEVYAWYKEKKKIAVVFVSEEQMWDNMSSGSSVQQDIAQLLVKEEQNRNLEKALWNLDPQYREIIALNVLMGIPLKQIAEEMGVNYITLRSWKRRSLKRLRVELEKREGGDEDEC